MNYTELLAMLKEIETESPDLLKQTVWFGGDGVLTAVDLVMSRRQNTLLLVPDNYSTPDTD